MSGIRINTNIASVAAQRRLADSNAQLGKTFERLSSGQRINNASDDAAGLAIASQLHAGSRVYSQAVKNINDGLSVLSISEGALDQLSAISMRQRELATQAANGTYSTQQRKSLDAEANALVEEFNRIVESTTFNGRKLLDYSTGSLRIQAGYGLDGGLELDPNRQFARAVGSGTYSIATTYYAGSVVYHSTVFDANRDGNLDTVTSDSGGNVNINLGNGNGTFKFVQQIVPPGQVISAGNGDFNNDGVLDVIAGHSGTLLSIYIGTGTGTFSSGISTTLSTDNYLNQGNMNFADLNGDGNLDVVTGRYSSASELRVLLGNGNGTFKAGISFNISATSLSTNLADFNGDGAIDIAVGESGNGVTSILLGNGDGSFFAKISLGALSGGTVFSAADINRDGIADVSSIYGTTVSTFLGNGNGTFRAGRSYFATSSNYGSFTSDMNGDGLFDIVSSDNTGAGNVISVLIGNGDGSFKARITSAGHQHNYALGDFNNDAIEDVLMSGFVNAGIGVGLGMATHTTRMQYLDLKTRAGALNAVSAIDQTLNRISRERGMLGSMQSRLETALNNVRASSENALVAAARITDTDVAQESANVVRLTILQQATTAVLAQANQQPALSLALIGG